MYFKTYVFKVVTVLCHSHDGELIMASIVVTLCFWKISQKLLVGLNSNLACGCYQGDLVYLPIVR